MHAENKNVTRFICEILHNTSHKFTSVTEALAMFALSTLVAVVQYEMFERRMRFFAKSWQLAALLVGGYACVATLAVWPLEADLLLVGLWGARV